MAEKIKTLAGEHKQLHVLTGSDHTDNIVRFLENEEQRNRIIDFFKKDTPKSFSELQEFKKNPELRKGTVQQTDK
ncbi:MAG: hypothetical protein JW834_04165 [Candidatus Diapherotrites archaeon]|nr:hypothetical protein [Candidatus Diapherotrites archaeon]